nr:ATPase subunit 4 [Tanacetum cinerariifolium]
CQPLVKDLHRPEPFSPTCFGESLIWTKRVGVASSKQLPLTPIDEKEIESEKSKEDFDPLRNALLLSLNEDQGKNFKCLTISLWMRLRDPLSPIKKRSGVEEWSTHQAHDLKIAGSNPVPAYFDFKKDPFKVNSKQALYNIVGSLYVRRLLFIYAVIEGNMMALPNDEIVPSLSGSGGPSHSPSWKEDSFEINVLLKESKTKGTSAHSLRVARDEAGPSRQDYVVINLSFEASMRNRILRLEQDDSPYLLGKVKETYWSDIRLMLEHAPS